MCCSASTKVITIAWAMTKSTSMRQHIPAPSNDHSVMLIHPYFQKGDSKMRTWKCAAAPQPQ
jgi:hypothetical protein